MYTIKNKTAILKIALSNIPIREGGNLACKCGPYIAKKTLNTLNTYTFSTRTSGLKSPPRVFTISTII